jgi:hypothetical protein
VRYLADTLRGCFLEVLDHFRPNLEVEELLADVSGTTGFSVLDEEEPGLVQDEWLSRQRVAIGYLENPSSDFVDVSHTNTLAELNRAPAVQAAFRDPEVRSAFGPNVRLDLGTICSGGPAGRKITQAVSETVYLLPTRPKGIAYVTRFDRDERCWAIFDDRANVDFTDPVQIDPTEVEHVEAIRSVRDAYGLVLPALWG